MNCVQNPCVNLVSTIGEGFYQSRKCQYYYGTTSKINIDRSSSAIVVLSNPECSKKVVYLNKLTLSNFSSSPIQFEVYSDTNITKNLCCSCDIAPGNTKCNTEKGALNIFYGNDIDINCGTKVFQKSINSFESSHGEPNGSVILCPGTQRAYLVDTICCNDTATFALSFEWFENPLS